MQCQKLTIWRPACAKTNNEQHEENTITGLASRCHLHLDYRPPQDTARSFPLGQELLSRFACVETTSLTTLEEGQPASKPCQIRTCDFSDKANLVPAVDPAQIESNIPAKLK